jgi:hypothetical protein
MSSNYRYLTLEEAEQHVSFHLMAHYNGKRPHNYNDMQAPAIVKGRLSSMYWIS